MGELAEFTELSKSSLRSALSLVMLDPRIMKRKRIPENEEEAARAIERGEIEFEYGFVPFIERPKGPRPSPPP